MAYDFNSLTKQVDEASNRSKFYTDFKDVDPNVLHQISELTDWMRTKAKGSDVREVIAQLFERTWLEGTKTGNANMEVAKARGYANTLVERLDKMELANMEVAMARGNENTLSDRLNTIDNNLANNSEEISTASARIDNIIATAGDGSVPSEVIDGRVGAFGNRFVTLNDSINSQFSRIFETLGTTDITSTFTSGYINLTGTVTADGSWRHSDYYYNIEDVASVNIYAKTGASMIAYYDTNRAYLSSQTAHNTWIAKLVPPINAKYVRFSLSIHDDSLVQGIRIFDIRSKIKHLANYVDTLNDVVNMKSHNIVSFMSKGRYIATDGTIKDNAWWGYTENYYLLSAFDSISLYGYGGAASVAYYDADKKFISCVSVAKQWIRYLEPPANAKYVRFSAFLNDSTIQHAINFKIADNEFVAKKDFDTLKLKFDNLQLQASQTHPWCGKNVGFIGDSITAGVGTTKSYHQFLADIIGINSTVKAVGGAKVDAMLEYAKELKATGIDFDAIFVFGGTNNFKGSTQMGSLFETSRETTNLDGSEVSLLHRTLNQNSGTFYGQLNQLMSYLKTSFPKAQIVFMTPLHRAYAKFSDTNVQPDELYANRLDLFIDDYVNAIKRAAEMWSIPVIDLFSESGLYPLDEEYHQYFANAETDRLHPNAKGHERIAKAIEGKLLTIPAGFRDI